MKICPRCQKTYADDNLNFCLEDGTTLQGMPAPAASSPPPTAPMNQPVTNPNQPSAGQPAWNTPQQQYGGQPAKKSSKAWVWVMLILVLVVLLCGGGLVGFIFYAASQADKVASNYNSNTSTTKSNTSTTTNKTSPAGTARTEVTTLDLDMFKSKDFSLYGTTEINGNGLTVQSKQKNSYYVLVAPEKYTTADGDARVTLRNVDNVPSRFGYGLVFHSDPESPLNQDYAFLIDTARKKYRVVHHSPHNEDDVVKWTSSSAINGASAENTLVASDQNGSIDLFINSTKVTTIKNTYGYSGGVIGLYVGDGVRIVFTDLEIRR
jgi:hypothetical protein